MPRRAAAILALALVVSLSPRTFGQPATEPDHRLDWWRQARFGMFIHWGLYAIPAGQWNGQNVPGVGEWIMHNGQIPRDDYATLVPQFNPVKFNADEWASIAKDAGMKYIVITTKHHDGFCMFDSKFTDYDIMATPFKGDIMREISDACHGADLRLGWYHSIWDWHHPDASGANFASYENVLTSQIDELLTNYGQIDVMWFDGEWIPEWTEQRGRDLYEHIRTVAPDVIVNNRVGKGRAGMAGLHDPAQHVGDFGTPEQEIPGQGIPGYDWETCMTMNDTWGYRSDDHNWKSSQTLIRNLIDTASKGGNFLLNVGPTALGEIPPESVERLRAMGQWLRINGEAIYGTTAGPFKRLEWGRCTRRGNRLHLHVFDWPGDGVLSVPGLTNEVTAAHLLADPSRRPLSISHRNQSLLIKVPARPLDPVATVIAVDLVGEPNVVAIPLRQNEDGSITLRAIDANVVGMTARYESGSGKDNIGFWTDPDDVVTWQFEVSMPGRYEVVVSQACPADTAETEFDVRVGDGTLHGRVQATSGWMDFIDITLGEIEIGEQGSCDVQVIAQSRPPVAVMNLRSVALRQAPSR